MSGSDKMKNKILCIESEQIFSKGRWHGLKTDNLDHHLKILLERSLFRERRLLETDPKFKQIIAQVVLRRGDEYFLHRQVNANETRLNGLCPLTFGGHIEEFDLAGVDDILQVACQRELAEEVEITSKVIKRTLLGLIYLHDENPVNHVHLGVVYVYDLDGEQVRVDDERAKREGLENIGFVDLSYLKKNRTDLTYWSRVIVDCL